MCRLNIAYKNKILKLTSIKAPFSVKGITGHIYNAIKIEI